MLFFRSHSKRKINGYKYIPCLFESVGKVIVRDDQEKGKIFDDEFWIVKEGPGIVLIQNSLVTKYAGLGSFTEYPAGEKEGTPGIWLDTNERTIYINEKAEEEYTNIKFPTLKGYTVEATYSGRYDIVVCLAKRNY
jgi:hypothetical protein